MAYIRICDICGKPMRESTSSEYKIKRRWCIGPDSGWEKIDCHDSCVESLVKAEKFDPEEFFSAERRNDEKAE